jgi:predicted Zn-dependent protease
VDGLEEGKRQETLGYSARMKCAQFLSFFGLSAVLMAGPAAADHPVSPTPLVDAAVERGEYPRAVELERQYAARTADRSAYEQAAKLAFELTQDRALERLSREWLRLDSTSEAARRFHAIALIELDRRDEAVDELERLISHGGGAPSESFGSLGDSLAELRNVPGVADVMAKLALRHPESADAYLAAGMLLLSSDQSARALQFARKAISLAPTLRAARWLEARALVVGGDCDAGLQVARTLTMDHREGDRLTRGWLMVACDRGAEAEAEFADLLKVPALRVRALEALAGRDLDMHRDEAAQRRYLELGNESAASDEAYWGLAVIADRAQDYARAAGLYRHILSGPRAVAAQLRAYVIGLDHAGRDYADRALDEILFNAPDLRVAITAGRVEVLSERGQAAAALALSERALRAYPDRVELRYARAIALDGLGRGDEGLRELDGVLKRRPDDPIAQNADGYSLADKGRELARAEQLIRSALAMRPDSAAIKDSLGWVLHRRGRSAEALVYLKAAYKLDPEPEVAAHLGEALWATGAQAEAEALWRSALERSPDDPHLRASIKRHLGSKP